MKNTLWAAAFFFISIQLPGTSVAGEAVSLKRSEKASLKILQLFSQEETLKSRLGSAQVDVKQISTSQCSVDVLRPLDKTDDALKDAANAIQCAVETKTGEKQNVKIDLSDLAIDAWGSRAEKSVSFAGPVAIAVYEAIARQKAESKNDPMYYEMERLCGPGGGVCIEMMAINQEPTEDSAAAIICSKDFVWDRDANDYRLDRASCVVVDDQPASVVEENRSVGEIRTDAGLSKDTSESAD